MTWHARLQLDYTVEAERCVLRHQHTGPLRILQSLYPEGDAVCHNVLVHPPGGLVAGSVSLASHQTADDLPPDQISVCSVISRASSTSMPR